MGVNTHIIHETTLGRTSKLSHSSDEKVEILMHGWLHASDGFDT
jgi:hypothetical protein